MYTKENIIGLKFTYPPSKTVYIISREIPPNIWEIEWAVEKDKNPHSTYYNTKSIIELLEKGIWALLHTSFSIFN